MAISNENIYVNGVAYSSSQIQVLLSTVPIAGVKSISYTKKRAVTNNMGLGTEPISYGYGQNSYSASIELDLDTVESLLLGAPNQDITLLAPFTITILWTPDAANPKTRTDILRNVKFVEDGLDVGSGDTIHYKKFELNYAGLDRS